jgi:hypothetical protein
MSAADANAIAVRGTSGQYVTRFVPASRLAAHQHLAEVLRRYMTPLEQEAHKALEERETLSGLSCA